MRDKDTLTKGEQECADAIWEVLRPALVGKEGVKYMPTQLGAKSREGLFRLLRTLFRVMRDEGGGC